MEELFKWIFVFKWCYVDFCLLKNSIKKCFQVCGCGSRNQCEYCNSTDYLGYDIQKSVDPKLQSAPDTNSLQCSLNTEYVDVKKYLTLSFNLCLI